jgi:ABC-2 type transport system permease protein
MFQPIMFLVLFTQLFSKFSNLPGFPPVSYLQIAFAGIIFLNAILTALQSGTSIVEDIDSGYLSKMLVTPVSRISILLGRLFSDATRIVIQSIIIIALAYALGASIKTGAVGLLLTLITVAFFGIAWSGISLAIGLTTKKSETVSAVSVIVTFPLLFMSTALVPAAFLPSWMQTVSNYNPMSYAVSAVRALTNMGYDWSTIGSAYAVIAIIAVISLGVTLYQFKKLVK